MKNIFKITLVVLPLFIVTSCVDDDKLFELDDFETGAIANMVQTANDDGFINLLDLSSVALEFTVAFTIDQPQSDDGGITSGGDGRVGTDLEFSKVSSIDVEVAYTNSVTGDLEVGVVGSYTSWPATVTLGTSDLISAIPSLNSDTDINVGDQFVFVTAINFADGRVYPAFVKDANGNYVPNYSVNFNGSGNNPGINFSLTYLVSCPSTIPTGNWTTVVATDACVSFQTIGGATAVLTELVPGTYEFDNFDFGYFGQCCGPLRAQFNDICNDLTLTGTTEFGIAWTGNGTYDPTGGANGNGRIEFLCHYDATFGGSGATDSIIFDKD